MATQVRKRVAFAGAGVVALAGLFGIAGLAATRGRAEDAPKPTPTVTSTSTPAPTATPVFIPKPTEPPVVEKQPVMPFGPVEAQPYRVHTGDGDCLNVRPVPGTTFQSDPRTCVPEGFLLWLFGEPVQADGHTWRYALGEGWVAVEFVKPAPGAATGFGPFSSVTVGSSNGESTLLARVKADGSVANLPVLPSALRGIGGIEPQLSPDGRWAAYGVESGYVPTLALRNMATGAERSYPQAYPGGWSPASRLLVRVNANCPRQCTWTVGWIDPAEGVVHTLTDRSNAWWTTAWAPDGESLYVIEEAALKQVWLDGRSRLIVAQDAGVPWGQLVLSDDGKRLLSSPFQGDIVIVDLGSGAVSRISRVEQILVGGKCGGSIGVLTAWLDANTIIWHESYAAKGGNGITISHIDGSGRRLIPFFTVNDIRTVAPGLVTFTTWETPANTPPFQLTWLLDTTTGEARPATVGAGAVWE